MTTATASKSALAEVKALEAALAEAEQDANQAGRAVKQARDAQDALLDERRRLAHRQPDLVDHQGQPASKSNPIAKIDAELRKLGDVEDLNARYLHQRRVVDHRKGAWTEYVRTHAWEIIGDLAPEAEVARDEANAQAAQAAEAFARYVKFAQHIQGYLGAAGQGRMRVPGADAAANFMRTIETTNLPLPVPERPE